MTWRPSILDLMHQLPWPHATKRISFAGTGWAPALPRHEAVTDRSPLATSVFPHSLYIVRHFRLRLIMRLLDAEALIYDNVARLAEFPDASRAPKYAILSHTWEDEEVLFEDIARGPQYEIASDIVSRQNRRSTRSSDSNRSGSTSSRSTSSARSSPSSISIGSEHGDSSILVDERNSDYQFDDATSTFSNVSNTEVSDFHVKAGWNKALNTSLLAVRDGLQYVWVDTCECIVVNVRSSRARLNFSVIRLH